MSAKLNFQQLNDNALFSSFSQNFFQIKIYRPASNNLKLQTLYGAYIFFPFSRPFFSHLSRAALQGEITLQPISPHPPEITGLSRSKWGF